MYKKNDILIVNFPFSDNNKIKPRPAVIVSCDEFNDITNNYTFAMITSSTSKFPFDSDILDYQDTGLQTKCVIRMKFINIEKEKILDKIGVLQEKDQERLEENLRVFFGV